MNEPVQEVSHSVQGQRLENVATNPQGVMKSWYILKKSLKEEEIVKYSNGWNPLSSKPQIKNMKDWNSKKRGASKEKASVASTSKPQTSQPIQEGKKKKKN
ncbi:hypothetical protein O181_021418 [Austropuccinia psidii MF-1]|uniref:Uncharacterized protein n=1 Tax=Austropuccinia psidii MF-1 TaxID=1389203 RepID=A0A9Q3GVF0_9BASI|nr:hypothetical protein [Austropuccinia psidii MF-1]